MSSMKSEIRACLRECLGEMLDEDLALRGFSRRKNSLFYWRRLPECDQRFEVHFEIHPKECPNAAAAVYPYLELSMDAVNSIAKEMACGNEFLEDPWHFSLREPIDWTSAKRDARAKWYLYQPNSVPGVVSEMGEYLEKWTIPFLDYYSTPHAICDAYDRKDERAIYTKERMIYVTAAMLLEGRKEDALAIAEKYYGKPGIRKNYANVFAYIESFKRA